MLTNHPKQGGIASFFTAVGAMALAGRPPVWPALDSPALTESFRAGPLEAHSDEPLTPSASSTQRESLLTRSRPLPSGGQGYTVVAQQTVHSEASDDGFVQTKAIQAYVGDRIGAFSDYPAAFCHGHVPLIAGLGLSQGEVQSVISTIQSEA